MEFKEKVKEKFKEFGFELSEEQSIDFEKFYNLLLEENSKYNLTAIVDEDDVILKHFIDSVLPIAKFNDGDKILDIGSGAGFPSIPLSIMNRNLNMVAIDAVNKKVNFINMVAKELKLTNLVAVHERAEDLVKKNSNREGFDIVTTRAVANLSTICEYSLPFLKVGGIMIAYKGSYVSEEIKSAEKALKVLGGKIKEVSKFELNDMERNVLLIEKIEKTPNKYPRSQNKPRTNPL